MRLVRLDVVALVVALAVCSGRAGAQLRSQTATVAVSLRVLPQASFDGAASHGLSSALVRGAPLRVEPAAGVRARLTYTAATMVTVTGAPLRGPGGASLAVRFMCRTGTLTNLSAGESFDCVGGVLAGPDGTRTMTLPLAVGAELSGLATRAVESGLYAGVVILTAAHLAY